MTRKAIATSSAPSALGTYSQAIRAGDIVYLSGQIPLDPQTMELVSSDIREQIDQVFRNLLAVARASGGDFGFGDLVKLNVYLTDLADFPLVNEVMAGYFDEPYPARAAIGVASLPKGTGVEMEGVMVTGGGGR